MTPHQESVEQTPSVEMSGNASTISGNLDGAGLTAAFSVPTSDGYFFRGDASIFNNTYNGFNSSSFTPASPNADALAINRIAGSGPATLTISFDTPILNPVMHINGMDRTSFDLSPTTTDLALLSQSNGLQLSAGGVLTDDDNSQGEGSVRFNGTFATLTMNLDEFVAATDGLLVQFSGTAVPEPSGLAMLGLAACGVVFSASAQVGRVKFARSWT